MNQSNLLIHLQTWYHTQCDGDWEHQQGIEIGTLDNPGWFLKINLSRTALENKPFEPIAYGLDDLATKDWVSCEVKGSVFLGAGGPDKLSELIHHFIVWAKNEAS